ncbi:hypothetical protein E3Z27_07065 [Pseudomonas mediterranea]|jgi:mRNA interferase YafO|uniref:Uncharacterized protein n=1 Tax=Pseudomonas mediterranea TaxID=183795 RepID=A0AAX2DHN6_9PSED|nr:hypothetical protein [Pseudomonas mediterranea]MBL0845041.1 hypothetical protein [Pseudomonas mediterranea]MDU9027528.1 hypothetical protein [Pseudomonas mediterranea]QHA81463.1 hypothetical protein E3Z27_07065 [Pseudomonas mediterranea]UZE02427.1 hypothetical protein LOY71_07315 [Pseudomonas mediterranea]SDU73000.1 hypothetical protein SAMN05216476_4902 [Pseudomonas mediterranea]
MPAIKISALFEKIHNWKNFAAQFYNYKVCGEIPAIFGRAEGLDLSEMYHIYLASTAKTQIRWAKMDSQCYRTALKDDPANDFCLFIS